LDDLGFEERQKLVRLMVEEVRVTGYHVDIRLRIPLDQSPDDTPSDPSSLPPSNGVRVASSIDRLRSFDDHQRRELPAQGQAQGRGALGYQEALTSMLERAGNADAQGTCSRTAPSAHDHKDQTITIYIKEGWVRFTSAISRESGSTFNRR
jgi:hypothetical protein